MLFAKMVRSEQISNAIGTGTATEDGSEINISLISRGSLYDTVHILCVPYLFIYPVTPVFQWQVVYPNLVQ